MQEAKGKLSKRHTETLQTGWGFRIAAFRAQAKTSGCRGQVRSGAWCFNDRESKQQQELRSRQMPKSVDRHRGHTPSSKVVCVCCLMRSLIRLILVTAIMIIIDVGQRSLPFLRVRPWAATV